MLHYTILPLKSQCSLTKTPLSNVPMLMHMSLYNEIPRVAKEISDRNLPWTYTPSLNMNYVLNTQNKLENSSLIVDLN